LKQTYRPSTQCSQDHAAFFLALFCLFYDVQFPVVCIPVLLSFIEFLSDNHLSPPTVCNYISSIKSKFKLSGVSIIAFDSHQISLGLLRISNVVPPSAATFNHLRHLRRCDITISQDKVIIHLRWSKTLQRHRQTARIILVAVPGSPMCPLRPSQRCRGRILSALKTRFSLTGSPAHYFLSLSLTFSGL
jgi:hypothetical protein